EYSTHSTGIAFDVQTHPHKPNLFSTCSYDGKVSIQSLPSTGFNHVPKYMKRSIGATFAFGGKLVQFENSNSNSNSNNPNSPTTTSSSPNNSISSIKSHNISISSIITDPEVLQMAETFQTVMERQDYVGYCEYKINSSTNPDEKTIWTFMKI